MTGLEKPGLRIGYTPLCDCAPLVVALELGLFAEHGLDVRLERQSSWATSRDLLRIGALDAAHMLAPTPIATWMEAGERNVIAPMALSLNGNTIALACGLFAEIEEIDPAAGETPLAAARALGALMRKRARTDGRPLRFAAVFAESNHHLDLRRWLAAGGVEVGRDVRIGIVPPGEMEQFLNRGLIDGFCVGEPWGSLAVSRGVGRIVASSYDLWSNRIEKVLGVGSQFAAENPRTVDAMLQALIRAAQWADPPENRAAIASLLVHGGYVDAPIEVVRRGLTGRVQYAPDGPTRDNPDFIVFHRYAANFPWRSQAAWFARALASAGLAPDGGTPRAAFRPALYARAAAELGARYPLVDSKPEAAHEAPWVFEQATAPIQMGREVAFDGPLLEQGAS
ncbi:MAG: ABC transporter substrate-binding protein [Hyphomonadaceae bacterium]|nr:MAG: putative nitrate transporter [Caulobacteraceae bacterium]MBT9447580.1 ABC transporter substrate-binding protein [Hyphomonadaceae bacterium]TPW07584.1 MAG: putative nitrate transporter [Alphaproteobacteria bacterium]